jgi:hypothetical protein
MAGLLGIMPEAIDGGIAKGKHRAVVNDGQGLELLSDLSKGEAMSRVSRMYATESEIWLYLL